jgi:hypothetical protein
MKNKEDLTFEIIERMIAFEIKLKEIEILAEEMRKLKLQIDLLHKMVEKAINIIEPVVTESKELERAELNKS